jgi:urease accessory protein
MTAIRPSAAVRAASMGIGRRLLSLYSAVLGNEGFNWDDLSLPCANAPVAYAIVFFQSGLESRHAAMAYGYNRLAGIVSAGLRLISIGQQQGQEVLTAMLDRLPAAVDRIHDMTDVPLRSFSPLLDIEQMNHQYVYSRLFRS